MLIIKIRTYTVQASFQILTFLHSSKPGTIASGLRHGDRVGLGRRPSLVERRASTMPGLGRTFRPVANGHEKSGLAPQASLNSNSPHSHCCGAGLWKKMTMTYDS